MQNAVCDLFISIFLLERSYIITSNIYKGYFDCTGYNPNNLLKSNCKKFGSILVKEQWHLL